VKAKMAETNAVFGGEHSGHFYFRDFSFADSGMLAALHTLAVLGRDDRALSEILADYARYAASGEISSEVADQAVAMQRVKDAYASRPGVTTDELDGLTVEGSTNNGDGTGAGTWWFNLRPSHTEPLLRLNVEAADEAGMSAVRDDVLGLLR
jgi:phosphomannomutase